MDTASLSFIVFGLGVAVLSNLNRSPAWRTAVLLVASVVFIMAINHAPLTLLPLVVFVIAGYAAVRFVRDSSGRVGWTVVAIVVLYIWLKKYTFLPSASFLRFPYLTLGLSYILFRVLHLVIETGENREAVPITPASYFAYALNFTTLVSGPIQRYDEFARDQFAPEPPPLNAAIVGTQIERIIRGFFKVNILAMLFNLVLLDAINKVLQPGPFALRFGAALRLAGVYPLFLYCNFSGYIDMVIASARLLRLRLPENFDRPFSASSFIDFWNRWHITLSQWLKTYVYNPLLIGMMRRVPSQSLEPLLGVTAFFVTFFLIGLWHGRTSEFAFFGVLQGGGVAVNKLWQIYLQRKLGRKGYKALAQSPLYVAWGRGLTYGWFAFSLFWFWSTWKEIRSFSAVFRPIQWAAVWLVVFVAATVLLAAWEWLRARLLSLQTARGPVLTNRYALVVYGSAMVFVEFVVTALLKQPAPDIVYKAF